MKESVTYQEAIAEAAKAGCIVITSFDREKASAMMTAMSTLINLMFDIEDADAVIQDMKTIISVKLNIKVPGEETEH